MTVTTPTARTPRATLVAYTAGIATTVAAAGYVAFDQLVTHDLDTYLHDLYDPYGKYGQPGAIYGYLYGVAAVGIVTWLLCLRALGRNAVRGRRMSTAVLGVAVLVTVAPLLITEYGQLVIPARLSILYLVALLFGLLGTITLWRGRRLHHVDERVRVDHVS